MDSILPKNDMLRAKRRFQALNSPNRLEALAYLAGEGAEGIQSGKVAEHLGIPQNSVSAQLLVLKNADLVQERRKGREVYYSCNYDAVRDVMRFIEENCTERRLSSPRRA